MNLNTFFQISVSVFCIIASIAILTLFVWSIMLRTQVNKLIKKLLEISEIAKETAGDTKAFVDRTIESLDTFKNSIFTFEFVRQIITQVVELIQNNSKRPRNKRK